MKGAYYNEINPGACEVLRELIKAGMIPAGDVDERDIREVTADDVRGYTQCHWFAGGGGWPLAFRISGWPDSRPVWSASCPCQPYSIVGEGAGYADERDLWPTFWNLAAAEKPPVVFGEQVPESIKHGWLDRVHDDMEAAGYEPWSVIIPACAVDKWHERERIFFVGDADSQGLEGHAGDGSAFIEGALADGYLAEAGVCNPEREACYVEGWDGLHRLLKPGIDLLVDGVPAGLAKLCAESLGNAIVPRVAAEFIRAFDRGA